jgi:hypothetical protein
LKWRNRQRKDAQIWSVWLKAFTTAPKLPLKFQIEIIGFLVANSKT